MTVHPYRTIAHPPRDGWREVLLFLDRFVRLRERQWYRRRVGGTWLNLCAWLVPGAPGWWHREGVDPKPSPTTVVLDREEWP